MKFGTKMQNGEFKLIWSHAKIDVKTFSGGGGGGGEFRFMPICWLVKMKMSNFSAIRLII